MSYGKTCSNDEGNWLIAFAPSRYFDRDQDARQRVFSRREFVGAAALVTGAALGSGLETKVFANEKAAEVVEPKHIPGGTARGTNTVTGETNQFFFGLDNRFMKGTYIGIDGEVHQAAFSEI